MNLFNIFKRNEKERVEKVRVSYVDNSLYNNAGNIFDTPLIPFSSIKNKKTYDEAFTNYNNWRNDMASISANNSLSQYNQFILNRLSYQECANLAQDTMVSKAIKTISFEMFKEGGDWEYDNNTDELQDKFLLECKKYDLDNIIRLACIKALEYGSSYLYFDVDDEDLSLPLHDDLNITLSKNKLMGIKILEPWQMAPIQVNNTNPLYKNYMEPDLWWILGAGTNVHSSRLFRLTFFHVVDLLKPMFNYSGLPIAFYLKSYISSAETTRQSVADLMMRFRTDYIKMSSQKIANPETQARIKFMNKTKNNLGTMLLAQDEEFQQVNTPLSGLSDILSQMYELVAMSAGLPVTKFLGLSPRGFNATGEHDLNNFYDTISGYQKNITIPAYEKCAKIITHFQMGINTEIKYITNPLNRLTKQEETDINQKNAQTLQLLIQNGMITAEDALNAYKKDDYTFKFVTEAPDMQEMEIFNEHEEEQEPFTDKVEDEDFKESLHPRNNDGTFKENGESEGNKAQSKKEKKQSAKTYKEMAGKAYKEYSGHPAQAINHLLDVKNGHVPAAAYKDGIGDIDFLWGEPYGENTKGYGFAHIIEEREIQGFDGKALLRRLPEIIEKGKVGEGDKGRKTITYNDSILIFEKNDNSNWLLTEYQLYDKMDEETRKRAKELKEKANIERKAKYGR